MSKPTDTAPEHSRLSPSKAHQWTVCTASIGFCEKNKDRLPPERTTPAAEEGTKAHTVAEISARNLLNPQGRLLLPDFANKDMKLYGRQYAELCWEARGPVPDLYDYGFEYRAPLFYLKKEKGTVDFWCWNKKGLHLIDYKYGYDPVSSIENKQMAIYAKSIIDQILADEWMHGRKVYGDTPVTMTIFQPRIAGDLVTWTTTVAELEKFAYVEIELHAKDILAGKKGVFAPGDKVCKYCPAAGICEARGAWLMADLPELEDIPAKPLPKLKALTDERILELYHQGDKIKAWLKDIESYVEGKVIAGMPMPGLKVVLSSGAHRKWTDEKAAGKLMLANGVAYDEVYETFMLSPAQAEKLLKDKKGKWLIDLYKLWFKPRGAPIVVPESDIRPEYKKDFTSEFLDVEEESTGLW